MKSLPAILALCWVFCVGSISESAATSIPLGVALDNTNLVWITSTNYPWYGTNDVTYDGVDAAVSGNRYLSNSISWLQTTVIGPGTLSFWWKVDSDPTDSLEFYIAGVFQDQTAGTGPSADWSYRTYAIPVGTNTLTWQYVKDAQFNSGADRGWVDQVIYTTGPPIPLQDALNSCGVVWTSGGNANPTYWTGETNVTHDGSKAAQSGAIYNLQESWIETTVTGVTSVSFWWKVSSENDPQPHVPYDKLQFYIDGVSQALIDGEVNWQQKTYSLSSLVHTLRWAYSKDDSDLFPKGQDRGWLDQVVFSPPLRAFPYTLTNSARLPDGRIQMSVVGEVGCACRVQFSTNLALTNWTTLTNFTTANASSLVTDAGASNSPQRFYRGVSP